MFTFELDQSRLLGHLINTNELTCDIKIVFNLLFIGYRESNLVFNLKIIFIYLIQLFVYVVSICIYFISLSFTEMYSISASKSFY